jgi:hypothetical protein
MCRQTLDERSEARTKVRFILPSPAALTCAPILAVTPAKSLTVRRRAPAPIIAASMRVTWPKTDRRFAVVPLADVRFACTTFANLSPVDRPQNLWSTACATAAVAPKTESPTSRAVGLMPYNRRRDDGVEDRRRHCGGNADKIDVGPTPIAMMDSDDTGARIAPEAWQCAAEPARLRELLRHNRNARAWPESTHRRGSRIGGQPVALARIAPSSWSVTRIARTASRRFQLTRS